MTDIVSVIRDLLNGLEINDIQKIAFQRQIANLPSFQVSKLPCSNEDINALFKRLAKSIKEQFSFPYTISYDDAKEVLTLIVDRQISLKVLNELIELNERYAVLNSNQTLIIERPPYKYQYGEIKISNSIALSSFKEQLTDGHKTRNIRVVTHSERENYPKIRYVGLNECWYEYYPFKILVSRRDVVPYSARSNPPKMPRGELNVFYPKITPPEWVKRHKEEARIECYSVSFTTENSSIKISKTNEALLFWKRLVSVIVGIDYRDPNLNKSDTFVVYSLQAIEYFQDFLAYKLQYPQNTSVIIPVMCGKQGLGKTFFTNIISKIFGEQYCISQRPNALTDNKFNDWLWGKLFIFFEEQKAKNRREKDWLKFYTNNRVVIESKGKPQEIINNYATPILMCNPDDSLSNEISFQIEANERRFFIMLSKSETLAQILEKYPEEQLAYDKFFVDYHISDDFSNAIREYLLDRDVSNFDPHSIPEFAKQYNKALRMNDFSQDPTTRAIYNVLFDCEIAETEIMPFGVIEFNTRICGEMKIKNCNLIKRIANEKIAIIENIPTKNNPYLRDIECTSRCNQQQRVINDILRNKVFVEVFTLIRNQKHPNKYDVLFIENKKELQQKLLTLI
ncbi:MAG: primase-helicase family protein [Succinivibrionaceae bacterium]